MNNTQLLRVSAIYSGHLQGVTDMWPIGIGVVYEYKNIVKPVSGEICVWKRSKFAELLVNKLTKLVHSDAEF